MNRIFTTLLIIALLLVVITMTACGGEKEHSFKDTVVAPTCISIGYTEHVCQECGYTMRDNIVEANPANHSKLIEVSVTEPSCEMGYTTYKCQGCSQEVFGKYTNPVHVMGEWVLVDTVCVTGGIMERYCKNPDCGYKEQSIDKTSSHVIENEAWVDPTYINSGYMNHYCDCGANYYHDSYVDPLSLEYLELELYKEWDASLNAYVDYYLVSGLKEGVEVADVVIPYEVHGIPVKVIDYRAFSNRDDIVTVTLTTNLTEIRLNAFELCDNLTAFIFTGTFTEFTAIQKGSEWATYLTKYDIVIDGEHYCINVKTVGATETNSGYTEYSCACGAYSYRDSYVEPTSAKHLVFDLREGDDGEYYVVTEFKSTIGKNVVIPAEINGIPVVEIDYGAFLDCETIVTLKITTNMKTIRSTAFYGCKNLTKVDYAGDIEGWNSIIGKNWKESDVTVTVVCSDGSFEA